jgi:hypothetical protein
MGDIPFWGTNSFNQMSFCPNLISMATHSELFGLEYYVCFWWFRVTFWLPYTYVTYYDLHTMNIWVVSQQDHLKWMKSMSVVVKWTNPQSIKTTRYPPPHPWLVHQYKPLHAHRRYIGENRHRSPQTTQTKELQLIKVTIIHVVFNETQSFYLLCLTEMMRVDRVDRIISDIYQDVVF